MLPTSPRPSPARPFVDTLHIVALAFWLAALLGSGAAAAVLFPTMKHLDPTLPAFAAYPHEHWKIAAGHAANKLFFLADIVQFAAAFLATVTFALTLFFLRILPDRGRSWPLAIRGVSLAAALTAAAYLLLVLSPAMGLDYQHFIAAASAGQVEQADAARAAFEAAHPKASTAISITAAAVFVALFAGVWNISTRNMHTNLTPSQNA